MTEPQYQIYPTRDLLGRKRWRWRYVAGNGEIVASGESYSRKVDCEHAVKLMRQSASAPVRVLQCG